MLIKKIVGSAALLSLLCASSVFAGSINGKYNSKDPDGSVVIKQISQNKISLSIDTITKKGNMCMVEEVEAVLNANKATYKDPDSGARIEITFKGDKVTISGDNSSLCGLNAYMNGTYKKGK